MMCLVRMESPGLTILPFHRMLVAPGRSALSSASAPPSTLKNGSSCRPLDLDRRDAGTARGRGNGFRPLLWRPDAHPAAPESRGGSFRGHLRPGTSKLVADLDVTVLHQVIFSHLL